MTELGEADGLAPDAEPLIRATSVKIKERWQALRQQKAARARQNEIVEQANAVGITAQKVLEEYARIAFANLGEIVEWDGEGIMKVRDPEKLGAVAEIVQSAGSGHPYRVKLYDKRAALDAIARYLGMLPLAGSTSENNVLTPNDEEDPREALIREMDRLAAKENPRSRGAQPRSEHGARG